VISIWYLGGASWRNASQVPNSLPLAAAIVIADLFQEVEVQLSPDFVVDVPDALADEIPELVRLPPDGLDDAAAHVAAFPLTSVHWCLLRKVAFRRTMTAIGRTFELGTQSPETNRMFQVKTCLRTTARFQSCSGCKANKREFNPAL
jgi:hypothetical protein